MKDNLDIVAIGYLVLATGGLLWNHFDDLFFYSLAAGSIVWLAGSLFFYLISD